MGKFTWENGTLISNAKVRIGGIDYEVEPEQYSGTTPLSANNLNAMQDGIYEDIGNISNLQTSENNLVGAINELVNKYTFSTTEKIIGKWINGKNLYIKTFQKTYNETSGYSETLASSIEDGFCLFGWIKGSGGTKTGIEQTGNINVNSSNQMVLKTPNNISSVGYNVTCVYTKL